MFIWTAKINRKKLVLALAAALCLTAAAATLLSGRGTAALATGHPKGVKTDEDRVAYLREWGWEATSPATLVEELELPKEFGDEYTGYLELQTGQGFDLGKYAGKRVRRYSYELLNYPTGQKATAHLLLFKNTVIGGEVLGDNFLHGLAMPE